MNGGDIQDMSKQQIRDKNRQRVIEVAQELFIDDGVAVTSINRIAKAAGLTPMSVYRYFGTKDGLVIAVWRDALTQFYEKFMERYTVRVRTLKTGFEKYVACMEEYTNAYTVMPKWYAYTREMLSYAMEENIETELNISDVFWKFTDKEIPIPVLIALREGIADGSIRADVDIHMIYQILINAYTGTNIYDGTDFAIDPVETLRTSSEIIANYIKNDS